MLKNRQIDGMLIATFLTTLFYASTYPYIHKEIMMAVSDRMVAINQIINCLGIVISGVVWNKYSDKIFVYYPPFCIIETIITTANTIWAVKTHNIVAYYITDTIIFAIVTRNICCGGVKLRAIRYTTEIEREHFDNNNNSISAIASIIGSIIAMILNLDFEIMLYLATFGNAIDNIFYLIIYKATIKSKK